MDSDATTVEPSVGAIGATLGRLVVTDRRHGRDIITDALVSLHQLTPEWPRDRGDAQRTCSRLLADAFDLFTLAGCLPIDLERRVADLEYRQRDTSAGWPSVLERGQQERTGASTDRASDPTREPGPAERCPQCAAASPPGYVLHRAGCTRASSKHNGPAGPIVISNPGAVGQLNVTDARAAVTDAAEVQARA